MTYRKGQVRNVFEFIDHKTKWFIVGGPADGVEAQDALREFPHLKAIGFEPDKFSVDWQHANNFPGEVHNFALWSENSQIPLVVPSASGGDPHQPHRMSSVVHFKEVESHVIVQARTLDSLSDEFGPFIDAFLWIDIEEAELECLKGSVGLLKSGAITAINAEVLFSHERVIADFLKSFGYREAKRWGCHSPSRGRDMCDIVYIRG